LSQERIQHDQLFKQLLTTFFAEFIELFFPDETKFVDLDHIEFQPQEILPDLIGGKKYIVDILAKARLKDGSGYLLILVEPQAYVQKDFNERLFWYSVLLLQKYRQRVWPIAVFSHDGKKEHPSNFAVDLPFLEDAITFKYYPVYLRKHSWKDYIQSNNPVAAALMSKMNFAEEEKVRVKLEFTRMVLNMKLDSARMSLLFGFFETYVRLSEEETKEYEHLITRLEPREVTKVMELTTSWHKQGKEEGWKEGLEQGLEQGVKQGKVEMIYRLIQKRFGKGDPSIKSKIAMIKDLRLLDQLYDELLDANSTEQCLAAIDRLVPNTSGGSTKA
jgi:hypothetical protein